MITTFGKFCRILRMDRDQLLKDMADLLGVSSAFLSSVENGKKEVPASWFEKIKLLYSLDEKKSEELFNAIEASRKELRINLEQMEAEDRILALSFARKLETISQMNERTKAEFRSFLKKTDD